MMRHDFECVCRVNSELSLVACHVVVCVSCAVFYFVVCGTFGVSQPIVNITTSTATPSASSTASAVATAIPSTTLALLALAVAAPPTRSRRSPDLVSANEVDSSSRSNRGEKGDRGTPLKERGATVVARSTYG
ncbi:unnamed protein product [Closterium sp. NIES-54]